MFEEIRKRIVATNHILLTYLLVPQDIIPSVDLNFSFTFAFT